MPREMHEILFVNNYDYWFGFADILLDGGFLVSLVHPVSLSSFCASTEFACAPYQVCWPEKTPSCWSICCQEWVWRVEPYHGQSIITKSRYIFHSYWWMRIKCETLVEQKHVCKYRKMKKWENMHLKNIFVSILLYLCFWKISIFCSCPFLKEHIFFHCLFLICCLST